MKQYPQIELNAEYLESFLKEQLPREFSLTSGSSTFFTFIEDRDIVVFSARGELRFHFNELFELLVDVLVVGEIRHAFFKDIHKNVSYKLPIVFWILYLADDVTVKIPERTVRVALESDLNLSNTDRDKLKAAYLTRLKEIRGHRESRTAPEHKREHAAAPPLLKEINRYEGELVIEKDEEITKVDILFSTPRHKVSDKELYNSKQSENLNFGKARLSIPINHIEGKKERPSLFGQALELFGFEVEDGSKHIVIKDVEDFNEDEFLNCVSEKEAALIFIHGFNVSFKEALYQSAQLKFDLKFGGNFILYSWPSWGSLWGYVGDKERAVRAGEPLAKVLQDISKTSVKKIFVLAHSMGTYCLSEAVKILNLQKSNLDLKVALAAPDVNSEDFTSNYAKNYFNNTNSVTIYASDRDRALKVSKFLHWSNRLGYSKPITYLDGMDTIDASSFTAGLRKTLHLNHSYVFKESDVITDLHGYFFEGKDAATRLLKAIPSIASRTHWAIMSKGS
ncbi:alpha/beta hydrolase [Alteromonas macleodii]|uniref:alpha/beta hydrolase n=1 Tax=Alteromonas macleodii TaxID=28108 RepID=UPI0029821B11|nr:alpha/beta hydrolase [Alteromonas macleodii]MDW5287025.1 alpha/beta hydrolase [Alteromonas macleodii]